MIKFRIVKTSGIAVLMILVNGCGLIRKNNSNDILTTVRLIYNIPSISQNGDLLNIHDSLTIFYKDSLILYQVPYKYSNAVKIDSIIDGIGYNYFIYHRSDEFGYKYDSINDKLPAKIQVSYFLRKHAFLDYPFDNFSNDTLIEANNEGGLQRETYLSKNKPDFTYADTSIYYYNPLMNVVNYTFSKKLDTAKRMKLVKIRFIYNASHDPAFSFQLPKREFFFELKKVDIYMNKELLKLMNEY